MSIDPRVDAQIDKAAPFARPILRHLRAAVHRACPEIDETIKWGRPFFMLGGRPFAMMAAFKAHAIFGFWRGGSPVAGERADEAGGQFGRLASLADLPGEAELDAIIREAAALAGTLAPARSRAPARPPLETPPDLAEALAANPAAKAAFDGFPPSHRRDYVEWLIEAKRPETRARRLAQTIEQLAQGKSRNWKYEAR